MAAKDLLAHACTLFVKFSITLLLSGSILIDTVSNFSLQCFCGRGLVGLNLLLQITPRPKVQKVQRCQSQEHSDQFTSQTAKWHDQENIPERMSGHMASTTVLLKPWLITHHLSPFTHNSQTGEQFKYCTVIETPQAK